jgi:hypothetical protein
MSRVPRLPLLTLAALLLTVSACGSDGRATPETAASPHVSAQQGGPQPEAGSESSGAARPATPAATPTAPTTTTTTTGTRAKQRKKGQKPLPVLGQPLLRPTPLASHLLSGHRMPTPDDETEWTQASELVGNDDAVVGACHKTGLQSIGALSSIRRTYTSGPGGAVATQVVAEFADPKSAWRAHEVLRAWQADCAERLDFDREEVGPLRSVTVRAGTGENYRTAYGPESAERGRAASLGIVRHGSHLSIVEIVTARASRPWDRAPARMAVRRIARTFA